MKHETKYTSGPWVFRSESLEVHADDNRRFGQGGLIASIGVADIPDDQQESNARLIAAAPELLEALELVLNNDRVMNALDVETRRAIMDAVTKATGGAPS